MQKFLCVSVLLLFVVAAPAMAKTPDGQTPSEETVCDGQVGAAYGLCNAYCEAMDCGDPNQQASDTACERVRANFLKHAGVPPPCDVTCPCPEVLPLFAAFVNGTEPIVECSANSEVISVVAENEEFSIVVSSAAGTCSDNNMPPFVPLTEAEALVCRLLLRDTAESQGIACVEE